MANQNQPFQVVLQRSDQSQSWGFRLQGGNDFTTPLSVSMVNPGGVAEQCGLKAGDAVLDISNTPADELSHEEAKRLILMSGNTIPMIIQRGSVQVWKPKVTPVEQLRPDQLQQIQDTDGEPIIQKTSLAASKMEPLRIGSAHNRSARPFPGFGGSSQPSYQPPPPQPQQQMGPPGGMGGGYNPYAAQGGGYQGQVQVGGYQEAGYQNQMQGGGYQGQVHGGGYQAQTQEMQQSMAGQGGEYGGQGYGAPASGPAGMPPAAPAPSGGQAPFAGFKSVRAPENKPVNTERQQAQYMTCKGCNGLCVGVFVRIKGDPYHPECFKCAQCGKNLKNQGHFTVGEQLYCEVCVRQVAAPPAPDMVPVPVNR
jgi:hypothetical protein